MLCFLLLPASLVLTSYGADDMMTIFDHGRLNYGVDKGDLVCGTEVVCAKSIADRCKS